MPIYAYRCEACGFAKDVLQKISDPQLTVCPECGKDSFKKQLTAAGFQEIGETPITLTGAHGQLVVNETGGYTYTPIGVTYSATDPIDSFTYQLIQPDGQFSTARLDVAVNINNGVAPVFPTATITASAGLMWPKRPAALPRPPRVGLMSSVAPSLQRSPRSTGQRRRNAILSPGSCIL